MENNNKNRGKAEHNALRSIKRNINTYAMVIALLVIWVLFSMTTQGMFISFRNLSMLFRQTTIMAILSIGMTFCIISGNFDLSVGSVVGFIGVVVAKAMLDWGLSPEVSILLALLTGLLIGLWNGFWIAVQKIPAFIVTLGSMMIFRGLTVWVSGGKGIAINNEWFSKIAMEYLPATLGWILAAAAVLLVVILNVENRKQRKIHGFELEPWGKAIAKYIAAGVLIFIFTYSMNAYKGVPFPVVILIAVFLIFNFVLRKTSFGRHVYAIGGNENAAKLSGINIKKTTLMIFTLMGLLSAVAGVVLASRIGTATPDAGNSYEMYAIAGCVIGGISLLGGRGKIFGVLVGALVIASLDNGMSLMNFAQSVQSVVTGCILIVAVWFDIFNSKRNEK